MTLIATIVGYLVVVATSCGLISFCAYVVLGAIQEARQAHSDVQIREFCERMANRLHGDADWFSEDEATWKLLKEIAADFRRGVTMSVDQSRERWRKIRAQSGSLKQN